MLTDAQALDVRRWMGYALLQAGETDDAISNAGLSSVSLTARIASLSAVEEEALTDRYLTPLAALEAGILGAADNMDTLIAGPWSANPREVQDRTALYSRHRRAMCGFLGFAPGPALGAGGITLVRA